MNSTTTMNVCCQKCYCCNDVCIEPCQYTKKIRIPGEGGRTWVQYCSKVCSVIDDINPLRVGVLGYIVYNFDGVASATAVTNLRLFKNKFGLTDEEIQKIPYHTTGTRQSDALLLQKWIRDGRDFTF